MLVLSLALVLSACSVHQESVAAGLVTATIPEYRLLEQAVHVRAAKARALELKAGTRWQRIGRIPQGEVYRTRDQVVIVNSFNVFEGDIVVSDDAVVGYYVAADQSFVAAKPTPLVLTPVSPPSESLNPTGDP